MMAILFYCNVLMSRERESNKFVVKLSAEVCH